MKRHFWKDKNLTGIICACSFDGKHLPTAIESYRDWEIFKTPDGGTTYACRIIEEAGFATMSVSYGAEPGKPQSIMACTIGNISGDNQAAHLNNLLAGTGLTEIESERASFDSMFEGWKHISGQIDNINQRRRAQRYRDQ